MQTLCCHLSSGTHSLKITATGQLVLSATAGSSSVHASRPRPLETDEQLCIALLHDDEQPLISTLYDRTLKRDLNQLAKLGSELKLTIVSSIVNFQSRTSCASLSRCHTFDRIEPKDLVGKLALNGLKFQPSGVAGTFR